MGKFSSHGKVRFLIRDIPATGCQLAVAVISTVISLGLLLFAVLALLQSSRATQPAEAPTAAFAKNGDDRSISWALHRSRHYSVKNGFLRASAAQATSNSSNPLVPGFFIYGDSTVDVGNNNNLLTFAKASYAPYGRDFDTHQPTGRFSNGRLSIDYLALFLGLPFVPAFLNSSNITSLMQGANFASAGAGILPQSGRQLGKPIPMDMQVSSFSEFKNQLTEKIGEEAANSIITKSIHFISTGSNDFIHMYLTPLWNTTNKNNFAFNELLLTTFTGEIEDLYALGIRKMAIVGLGPLGCAPSYLSTFHRAGCVDSVNFVIAEFNMALKVTVADLSMKHENLNIVFCDIFGTILTIVRNPSRYGFQTARNACCGWGTYGGNAWPPCLATEMACDNANDYVWWDMFHPTAKVNYLVANSIWTGKICEPMSLQELALA